MGKARIRLPGRMRVLAFTGLPGSGKSEAVAQAREQGIPVIRMGDFVLQEVRARGLPEQEEHVGPVATGMREQQGDDVWAKRTVRAIRDHAVPGLSDDAALVVVDGVRSPAEVERFRSELGDDFRLVAIVASDETRHGRILKRGRSDDTDETKTAIARDERERGWGLDKVIEQAEHQVQNEGSLAELKDQVSALLERLTPDSLQRTK